MRTGDSLYGLPSSPFREVVSVDNTQFLATVRTLVSDIKEMSSGYPSESRYIFETLTQREAITPDEIKLALNGQVESDRAPVIIRTLMLVKNALFELQGKRMHDPVPCRIMPKEGGPEANSNDPQYNMRYGYRQKKLRESNADKKEKERAKELGFWSY
jgi:hypothetical protein